MAGQGKYTTYIDSSQPQKTDFYKKLYGTSPFSPGGIYAAGDNIAVAAAVAAAGNMFLLAISAQSRKQSGDIGHFPDGVSMDYSYAADPNSDKAPDLTTVIWESSKGVEGRGGAATAYFPDLISAVDAVPRDNDPGIATTDIKPNYVPGADGTVNPATTNDLIDAAALLLAPIVKGHSHL